ncbi:universal stress protein [Roseospirillum parvum]|uniref:Nucleotide-binding universal stress protein, UspA family n=1 Tax=Roseospirillum parvum TaxID=83401 RepID=A0A1G7TV14_9PROT|nr:universal stress protein [Roseospirillum parvum]SDG38340.1 Nucleotide-binding universal stress protein, UspA family [Roseospirillum parvum]
MSVDDKPAPRTFLVVVDDSDEMRAALSFACRRARRTGGRVALLTVIGQAEFHHFSAIGNLMNEEAREEAEHRLNRLAAEVHQMSGQMPVLFLREGKPEEELLALIEEEPTISILVLAASTSSKGPGPLVSALAGRLSGRLHIPVTIVPGDLADAEIDRLA